MSRGEREQRCFNRIKNCISDTECLFGLTCEDQQSLETIINTAFPNPSLSKFPDFIFPNGFIEHFQITSSKTNKKGSTHKREESQFKQRVEKENAEFENFCNETPNFETIRSKAWIHQSPEHRYEWLQTSLIATMKSHMQSLNCYAGCKEIGIFMIEYSEMALAMYEQIYHAGMAEMSLGDLRKPETLHHYSLSRDKEMLRYLYNFRDTIKFIFFVNHKRCEIIKIDAIPTLVEIQPWNYLIYPLVTTTFAKNYCISVQDHQALGKKDNE